MHDASHVAGANAYFVFGWLDAHQEAIQRQQIVELGV
jgi:hypothetical protein